MKPEIKAMLPEFPPQYKRATGRPYYNIEDIEDWLDKLTEGAQLVYLNKDSIWCDSNCSDQDTHTALLICPREIKKQTPLEIAVDALNQLANIRVWGSSPSVVAREALAKIEAAK